LCGRARTLNEPAFGSEHLAHRGLARGVIVDDEYADLLHGPGLYLK
jgi:hypothetical protein